MQSELIFNSLKIFFLFFFSFVFAMAWTPFLTRYLYKYKAWKKSSGKGDTIGDSAPSVFDSEHKKKETSTPRMGGLLIWITVLAVMLLFRLFPVIFSKGWIIKLNFLRFYFFFIIYWISTTESISYIVIFYNFFINQYLKPNL